MQIPSGTKVGAKDYVRFIVLSLIGIFLFFIPVKGSAVPVSFVTNTIKSILGPNLRLVVVLSCFLLFGMLVLAQIFHVKRFQEYLKGEGWIKRIFFTTTFLIVIMILTGIGPAPIQHPEIGGKVLNTASTVMLTIMLAGWAVVFILKSGIVEFVSVLVEPIMRPVFRLPGESAVNAVSSFVSSASVGVYFTDRYYRNGAYTEKEACSVVTNFSVISVGYMAVLCSLAGIDEMYGTVLIWAFVLMLVMGAICMRIPPLSLKKNVFADGTLQTPEQRKVEKISFSQRLHKAALEGALKSREFNSKEFWGSLWNAVKFCQKIIAVMITSVTVVLTLVYYTPIFQWLGVPIAPVLSLLGIPDAAKIAPAVLIGIVEVTLPAITISGLGVAPMASFFIVMLSILQIIFFTECGNAVLSSTLPIKFGELVLTFFVRTIIAIPLIAILAHLLF